MPWRFLWAFLYHRPSACLPDGCKSKPAYLWATSQPCPTSGLYISQFQVKNLGARKKNPWKILPSSNTSKPMALRNIVSVVPPYLPQSLAPVPTKECSLHSPKLHPWLGQGRPNSWALPCLEPVLHFHPIRLLEISTSLSSLRAASPHQSTSTVDLVSGT